MWRDIPASGGCRPHLRGLESLGKWLGHNCLNGDLDNASHMCLGPQQRSCQLKRPCTLCANALLQQTSARSAAETADALDELLAQQFIQVDGQSSALAFPHGKLFGTGLSFRLTTGAADNDANAVAANEIIVNMSYV